MLCDWLDYDFSQFGKEENSALCQYVEGEDRSPNS